MSAKEKEAELANSLGLESATFHLDGDVDSDDDAPVRSPQPKGASYFASSAPAGAVSLGRSTGGGTFGHAASKGGGGGGDSAVSGRALAQLSEQVQALEGELAAATAKVGSNAGMLKLQLASYKKRVVEVLRAKDKVIEEAAAANPALAEQLAKAQKATEGMEKAGPSLEASLDTTPEALRGEVIRLQSELSARTAAERCVRIKARAARALAAEVAAAVASVRSSGAMEPSGPSALLASYERFTEAAAAAAQAAASAEEDFDFEAGSGGSGSGSGSSGSSSGAQASSELKAALAAATAALEKEKAAAAALQSSLSKAQGEATRAKDEASALREKSVAMRASLDAQSAAHRHEAERNSLAASSQAEQERLQLEVERLNEELREARAKVDSARAAASGATEGLAAAVAAERDQARSEAAAAKEEAGREAREAAEARAREAAVRADVGSLRQELEALKAGESKAESRALAESASAAEAAASLEAALARCAAAEAALGEAKAKAKADKDKLKRNAMSQFDELKAKALEEIELVRGAGESKAAALSQELAAAQAQAAAAQAQAAAAQAEAAAAKGGMAPVARKCARSTASLRQSFAAFASSVRAGLGGVQAELVQGSASLVGAVRRALEGQSDLEERYKKEMRERRRLFNLVQELRGNIRVYCRVRPISEAERGAGEVEAVGFPAEGELCITSSKRAVKAFEFDQVFQPSVATEAVYREVEGLVQCTLDGYNVCIFAYGQTGSGKTFTMEGNASNPGINYRSLDSLFALRDERSREGWAFDIRVSLLEIYNEDILDMLAERGTGQGALKPRESKEGMIVPGLIKESVQGREDVVAIMRRGYKNRTTFATNMNEHSSRSHAMLSVYVQSTNALSGVVQMGKLHLVDLAGSERLSRSGAAGERLKEAQAINTSLSALGDVIMARAQKAKQ